MPKTRTEMVGVLPRMVMALIVSMAIGVIFGMKTGVCGISNPPLLLVGPLLGLLAVAGLRRSLVHSLAVAIASGLINLISMYLFVWAITWNSCPF